MQDASQLPNAGTMPARDAVAHGAEPVLHYMQRWLPLSEQFVHRVVVTSRHRAIVVSRLPIENREAFPHRPVFGLGWFLRPPRRPSAFERRFISLFLAAVASGYRCRLVHHHHGYRLRDVRGVVRRLKLPLVVSLHGHDVTTHAAKWPGDMLETLALADAIVVPSRYLADRVIAELGMPAKRIHVIPSGVDLKWFTPTPMPDGVPEALFVGRFVEKKGLDVLLSAWSRVRERVPEAGLRLLGAGPLESLARAGGPGVTLELTDPRQRATQVRDAIRRARVVVTPSRTAPDGDVDTLLLVNLEAQASGRPIVTTRHGGIPEFVQDGETGLLVPEADPAALADAMIRLLTEPALAGELGAAGPIWARRFDVVGCTALLDDLYDSLIR